MRFPLKMWSLILLIFCFIFPVESYGNVKHKCEITVSRIFIPDQAIVFDWDDTLLPTSFIKGFAKGRMTEDVLKNIREEYESEWIEYDRFVSKFLKLLSRQSDLYLITNAKLNWVKASSSILLPQTHKFLRKIEMKNRLISAKEQFFLARPFDEALIGKATKRDWKSYAFFNYLSKYKSIISFGDAEFERTALFSLPDLKNEMIKKNIKLLKHPDMGELLDQLVFIYKQWKSIVKEGENVDVDVHLKFEISRDQDFPSLIDECESVEEYIKYEEVQDSENFPPKTQEFSPLGCCLFAL